MYTDYQKEQNILYTHGILDVGFDLSGEWTGRPGILQSTGLQRVRKHNPINKSVRKRNQLG